MSLGVVYGFRRTIGHTKSNRGFGCSEAPKPKPILVESSHMEKKAMVALPFNRWLHTNPLWQPPLIAPYELAKTQTIRAYK